MVLKFLSEKSTLVLDFTFIRIFVINDKMDYISLFGYMLVISISLISILVAFHLYNKYSLKFYRSFAYCIICGNLFSLLAFIGHYLTESIFQHQPVEISIKAKFALILNFMSMPFLLLCLFFIMVLFRDIFDKPLSPSLKRISLITGLIMAVLATFMYIDFFSQNPSVFAETISIVLEILAILIFLVSVSQGFFNLREIKDLHHRRVLLIFTLLFLGILIILTLNIFLFSGLLSDIALFIPWELILLIYMVKKMNEFYLLQPNFLEKSGSLEKIYQKYHITLREQEIITLICRGKTNRDIEAALYISLQTVKNNIYNIFKKLKVKNRVELINFIRLRASSEEMGQGNA